MKDLIFLLKSIPFLLFNTYMRKDDSNHKIVTKWVSKCYSTLIGFYHKGKDRWGCFYAEKEGVDHNQITNGEPKGKLLVVQGKVEKISYKFKEKLEDSIFQDINFLQTNEKEKLELTSNFKDHAKVVERINSMNDLWKATNYEEFSKLTIKELNSFAGRRRHHHRSLFEKKRKYKKHKKTYRSKNRLKSIIKDFENKKKKR